MTYNTGTVVNAQRNVYPYTSGIAVRIGSTWIFEGGVGAYNDGDIKIIDILTEGYEVPIDEPRKIGAIVKTDFGKSYVRLAEDQPERWLHFITEKRYTWSEVAKEKAEVLFEGVLDA